MKNRRVQTKPSALFRNPQESDECASAEAGANKLEGYDVQSIPFIMMPKGLRAKDPDALKEAVPAISMQKALPLL